MVRDKNGRFIKGNGGGPGRPKRPQEEMYYRILMTTCTADDWTAIVKRAVTDAKRGDGAARKWLADYLIGPPVERKEVTGLDAGPIVFEVVYEK